MMGGKNEPEEAPAGAAEWLVTYSDMVTLMLTFFVLLFAISNVDALKFKLLSVALSSDGITAEEFLDIQLEYGMEGVGLPDPEDPEYPGPDNSQAPSTPGNESLDALYEMLNNYIVYNDLADSISLVHNGDNLLMTLTADIWFAVGSAEITPAMRESAVVLANMLSTTQDETDPFEVVVVGHTDTTPISTAKYPSNWYLSADRAVNFLGVLMDEAELDPNKYSARGCGEYYPIAENDTPEGRQLNRRVEVLISQGSMNNGN